MIQRSFVNMLLIFVVLFPLPLAYGEEPIGYVTALIGTASLTHAGEQAKTSLALNDPVYFSDTIETAALSKIQILMEDESVINLGENAQITITKHLYQPARNLRSSVYKLLRGKVRVVVGKLFSDPKSGVEVETPTSVIGIRMTEFMVHVVSPELTIVITLEGEVTARNIRPDLVCVEKVAQGFASRIARDACPTPPIKTPSEKMEEILRETEAYLPYPSKEMPFITESLNKSVQNALAVAPLASILGVGLKGTATPLLGKTAVDPLATGATNLQLQEIQPGEVSSTFPLPPVIPPLPPLPLLPVILPPPPPPPH
jgi:hypothetical protein